MAIDFREGYKFFQKNAGALFGADIATEFGTGTVNYVEELDALEDSINAFKGYQTSSAQLKGDVAEFWHAGTFNTNAALNNSANRAVVNRSNEFASVDVSLKSGESFSLKYDASGVDSAKQQAASVFQRFKEYQSHGGKDSFDQFLSKRNYTDESVLNDPIYSGQFRVIPRDQMEEATRWLSQKIAKESVIRPDQVKRYQDTLDMLKDKLSDSNGTESIPLSKEEAQKLAELAKKGEPCSNWFGQKPDLLLMDGGRGQVSAAKEALAGTALADVPLYGMVKDDHHRTRAIVDSDGREIAINMNRGTFTFITAIQDETHRFANAYRKQQMKQKSYSSTLTEVPGVGPKTAKALLAQFKSVGAVKDATPDQLENTPGVGRQLAQTIYEYFHGKA